MNASPTPSTAAVFSLTGKVVILTGGAGLYGRGLAAHIAAAGATLVLAARNVAALEQVAAAECARGRTVHALPLDQGEEASILRLRDSVLERLGRIDGLVNNAVARPMRGPDAPLADWEASMRVNASGLFALTRAVAEAMAERGAGSIVNIGSIQGMVGPDLSLYAGTTMQAVPDYFFHKAGMVNLTRYFAACHGPRGVRVNCVSPGGFFNRQPEAFVERYAMKTFLRRMAGPDDLGPPVVFLLSDAAAYITGANLPVDGGYTAQ
jgi:NAD(P)-dependent dehydrogenase (short-subunit alcohol dehydrogenase family)